MYVLQLVLGLSLAVHHVASQACIPGDTCKLPECRCWDDPALPGGLQAAQVPQTVLLSFEYAVNKANVDLYTRLLKDLANPNGCGVKATFFVQELNTDFSVVSDLHQQGHEIAMTSSDGIIPADKDAWLSTYQNMKTKISQTALIPEDAIKGSRGPELSSGGDDQYDAIQQVGLSYDSTCSSFTYSYKSNLLWPYTYDFTYNTPQCSIGKTPASAHPGKWQFLVAAVRAGNQNCASLSACSPFVTSATDAFNLINESYEAHYQGNKSPFVLYIDPLWLTVEAQYDGTRQFLEKVIKENQDTWFVTSQQALAWIQDPVTSDRAVDFRPWGCN